MTEQLIPGILSFQFINLLAVFMINVAAILIMATVITRNSFRDRLTSVFFVMGVLMLLWVDFAYLARAVGAENLVLSEFFLRIAWTATPPFFAFLYLITAYILRRDKQLAYLNYGLLILGAVLGGITAFTDYIIKGVAFTGRDLDIVYGKGFYPFLVLISLYIVATLVPFFTSDLEEYRKKRVRIFLAGVLLFYVANLIFNISLPAFFHITHLYYFGDYSLVFLLGLTAYSIIRYQLMDIKAMVFRSVGFTLLTGLFFILYGLLIYVAAIRLQAYGLSVRQYTVLTIISSALAIPAYHFFRRFLRVATDRFLFQRRTDYRVALLKASSQLSRTIKIEEVNDMIIGAMRDVVRSEKTLIFLQDPARENYDLRGQFNSRLRSDIAASNMLVEYLYTAQGPVLRDELATLSDQLENRHPARAADIKAASDVMQWLDASVAVPLFVDKGLIGFILLGAKISGEQYQSDDITFLAALAPQAATALENARLYKESLEFGQKLNAEVERATHDLQIANRELMNIDKAKSEFMNIASHQLYTPITALRGYVSMMLEGDFGKVTEEQKEILTILMKSATRLIELIKNLLDISRIESGKFELKLAEVSIPVMAKELVQDLLPNAITKKLQLEFHPPEGDIPLVIADEGRLRQVMMNFIDNAVKYTDAGRVDVYVKTEGENVVFYVKDTGKGISEEDLQRLFNKFTRVGGASRYHTEGTGLGLYVARQIIREHRGEVEADSEGEGKGSTFTMVMPAANTPRSLKLGEEATVVIKAAESLPAEGENKG